MSRVVSNTARIAMILTALLTTTANAASIPTTVGLCGQIVKGDAVLVNDLDCAPNLFAALILESGSLDMQGFTIRGGQAGVYCVKPIWEENVFLRRNCKIFNGTIEGSTVAAVGSKKLTIENVTIAPASGHAILLKGSSMEFNNLTMHLPSNGLGIYDSQGKAKVEGTNLVVEGGTTGIVSIKKVAITGGSFTGYGETAILAKAVDVTGVSFSDGEVAIYTQKARVTGCTVTGQTVAGVRADGMRIVGSTFTGNALDLESERSPVVQDTTCETSNGWGVCSND